jgi:hypothetical protein
MYLRSAWNLFMGYHLGCHESHGCSTTDPAICCLGSICNHSGTPDTVTPLPCSSTVHPYSPLMYREKNRLGVKFHLVEAKKESTDTKRCRRFAFSLPRIHHVSCAWCTLIPSVAIDSAWLLRLGVLFPEDFLLPAQSLMWSPSCRIPSVGLSGATTGPSSTRQLLLRDW